MGCGCSKRGRRAVAQDAPNPNETDEEKSAREQAASDAWWQAQPTRRPAVPLPQ